MVLFTLLLVATILCLFASMILSAMSSNNINKNNSNAKRYATIAAVVDGLAFFLVVVILIVYLVYEYGPKAKKAYAAWGAPPEM